MLLSLVTAVAIFTVGLLVFELMEPGITNAATKTVTVTQSVTGQISFKSATKTVAMGPAINGITGGVSSGTSTQIVTTNNSTGYNMTIQFASTTAMDRNGGGGTIHNYTPATAGTPDYSFGAQAYGQFAYTTYSTTTGSDVVAAFLSSGGTCGSGTSVAGHCWLSPSSTAAKQIINRTTATPSSGATSSVAFQIQVPNNPNPSIPTGTYTATATLTALTNP